MDVGFATDTCASAIFQYFDTNPQYFILVYQMKEGSTYTRTYTLLNLI